jgi:hypothetical protein
MIPSVLLSALKEGFQKLINTMRETTAAIKGQKFPPLNDKGIIGAINRLGEKIKEPSFSVTIDTSVMEDALEDTAKTIKGMKPTDLKKTENLLSTLVLAVNSNSQKVEKFMSALDGLKTKFPEKMKVELDDMQMRSMRSGSMPLNPAPLAPRSINIKQIALADANTEYSTTLSSNTTGYFIKLRAQGVLLYMASATGKLKESGDGLAYMTVPQNGMLSPMGMDVGGKTIFFETGSASQVVEVQEFIA